MAPGRKGQVSRLDPTRAVYPHNEAVIQKRAAELMAEQLHIHLVSDATGETNHQIARACMVQFQGVRPTEHVWSLVRTSSHIDKILTAVEAFPGPVLFTLVDSALRRQLIDGCQKVISNYLFALVRVSDKDPVFLRVSRRNGVLRRFPTQFITQAFVCL